MALKSTIYKADCQIADIDRGYYQPHNLTIALHPSETEERMMVRLLAFVLNAHEHLQFCKGLSADDEPDLWQKSLTDDIELWIESVCPMKNGYAKHPAGRIKSSSTAMADAIRIGGNKFNPNWNALPI